MTLPWLADRNAPDGGEVVPGHVRRKTAERVTRLRLLNRANDPRISRIVQSVLECSKGSIRQGDSLSDLEQHDVGLCMDRLNRGCRPQRQSG